MNNQSYNLCILILFLTYTFSFSCYSQEIILKGSIKDSNKKAIAYASIGIENKGIGCISNDKGMFSLSVPDSLLNNELTVSHLGYRKHMQKIRNLVSSKEIEILLEDSAIHIPEVSVSPNKIKWIKSKRIRIPGGSLKIDSLGEEIGVLTNIKSATVIEQIKIPILKCTYDSVKVRINIYQLNRESNATPLFTTPIYKTIPRNQATTTITITPTDRPFIPQGQIAITLEMLEIHGNGELLFPVYSAHSVYKKIVLDRFEEIPFSMKLAFSIRL